MSYRYQKIYTQIWHDEKFRALPEDGRALFFYLMTCSQSNMIGLFVLPKLYMQADLDWAEERLGIAFKELYAKGFIKYDEEVRLLLICNHLKHNKIENKNCAISAVKILKQIPKSPLYSELLKYLQEPYHKPFAIALQEGYGKPEAVTEAVTVTEESVCISAPEDEVFEETEILPTEEPQWLSFEEMWERYPEGGQVKQGKAYEGFKATVKNIHHLQQIEKALVKYLKHLEANDWKSPQAGDTWFGGGWKEFVNWREPKKPEKKGAQSGARKSGKFHNINDQDFRAMP